MTLLRKYISAILKESSVIPEEVYKIPVVPYPEEGTRESAQDLAMVIHQKSNRVVPEDLQDACDSDMEGLFEDYLSSKGVTYNSSYFSKMVNSLLPIISTLKNVFSKNSEFCEIKRQRFIAINGTKNIHKLNFLI